MVITQKESPKVCSYMCTNTANLYINIYITFGVQVMPRDNYRGAISEEVLSLHLVFAQNIKEARKARGWTQIEAAERCLLSRGAYRAVESGELGTAIGVYWLVLDTLGLVDGIAELAAPHKDEVGRRNREVRAKR